MGRGRGPAFALLARLLGRHGHAVTAAATRAAALAAVDDPDRGPAIGLLVCDVGLPDGDGCDVVRASRGARPRAAIVVLTARAYADDVERCRAAGADPVLIEPLGVGELLRLREDW